MTELRAASLFFSAAAPASSVSLRLSLLRSFSVHFFHSLTPSHPTARGKSKGKVIKAMSGRENNTQGDGESCGDEGGENKTNGEECTKGNEAKRESN